MLRRGETMAIRIVIPSGVTIEVDGDDDMTSAVKMVRMLTAESDNGASAEQTAKPRARRPRAARSEPKPEPTSETETEVEADPRWWPFVANISVGARHVLACILASPGISRADLAADAAGGKHNALSGFLRSIPTQATNAGIEKDDVYRTLVDEAHGQGILFFPGPLLRSHGLGEPAAEGEEDQ